MREREEERREADRVGERKCEWRRDLGRARVKKE